jgi:hypothetical protein
MSNFAEDDFCLLVLIRAIDSCAVRRAVTTNRFCAQNFEQWLLVFKNWQIRNFAFL